MQSRSSRQGFSLIEVAIALVIFVIGALAIIKIFPGALNVIGNNGDQQIAMNLNRDVGARLKSDGAVPYATFNIKAATDGTPLWTTADNTDHTNDYVDFNGSVIGVPSFNVTLPTTQEIEAQANDSALARYRGIIGEQGKVFKIGADFYTTTQFPISVKDVGGVITPIAPTISQEYIVRNVRINKIGKLDFSNATTTIDNQEYRLSDSENASLAPDIQNKLKGRNTSPAGSMLYVSYRYFGNTGKIWGVRDEALPVTTSIQDLNTPDRLSKVDFSNTPFTVVPPTTTRGALVAYDINNQATTGTIAEAIDVRVKRLAGPGVFQGLDDKARLSSGRCGLIQLPSTVSTDTVSIDYSADWSLLMQQGSPSITPDELPTTAPTPSSTPVQRSYRQIALGAPFIEDQTPVGIYSLLLEPVPPPTPSDFPVYNSYVSRFGTDNQNPDATTFALLAPTESDLRAGKVTFSVANSESKARVAYRTRDSWAQQLSVAASAYKPYVAGSREPWRDYYLGDDNYIYFHASEAGKTVNVSYLTTDGGGSTIVARPFVIDQQIIATPTGVPASFADSGQVSRAQLTNFSGGVLGSADLVSIQGISGNSVTIRTAYINGDKYAQTLLTSNRGTN